MHTRPEKKLSDKIFFTIKEECPNSGSIGTSFLHSIIIHCPLLLQYIVFWLVDTDHELSKDNNISCGNAGATM